MEKQEALYKNGRVISILDLPEQIFRNIFRHISTHELFATVRKVDPNVRKYVADYLPLIGSFMLIKKQGFTTSLIHIFKPNSDMKKITIVFVIFCTFFL